MKRLIEIVISAGALFLLAPCLAAIAISIVVDSGWPVLFSQVRVGRNFRPFRILKFRSMRAGAAGPLVTASGDSRVTRVGKFLRATRLDELPQFWNVLVGDMSLVGPRPEVPVYVEQFRDRFARILAVRPGITDASTLVFRDEEEILAASEDPLRDYVTVILPEKLRIAEAYIRERSLRKDLSILIQTVGVLRGKKAGGRLPVRRAAP